VPSRRVGGWSISENVFLSILNEQVAFATSFETRTFDGILYNMERRL
jgi:hypothetical protein